MKSRTINLRDYGYPEEGIIEVSRDGGPDGYEVPQEAFSARTCENCRKCNLEDWTCTMDGKDVDPETCTCDDIEYIEKELDCSYGFRYPVMCEYSSPSNYVMARNAIVRINQLMCEEREPE